MEHGVERGAETLDEDAEKRGKRALDGDDQPRSLADKVEDWSARWDTLPVFVLRPLETARVTLDFRDVPPGFEYNEHYAIVVLGVANI